MNEHLSLSELNGLIREALEMNFVEGVWVVAEIASLRTAGAGHAYFELVEKTGDKVHAKIRANCWSYTYRQIASEFFRTTGQTLDAGLKVLLYVELSFHEVFGLSLNIKGIDSAYTLGDMARRKQEVIERLTKERLLDQNKALELPLVVQNIAIISSEGAAGYEDFMEQLSSNDYGIKFYTDLYQASMQGEKTSSEVTSALLDIQAAGKDYDAVVIIRGGGSNIDLNAFDSYEIAKAIAVYQFPVLSGIGHERDESVVDIVSNQAFKTPTAVAQFIIDTAADLLYNLDQFKQELKELVENRVAEEKHGMERMVTVLERQGYEMIQKQKELLAKTHQSLPLFTKEMLQGKRQVLSNLFSKVSEGVLTELKEKDKDLLRTAFKIKSKTQEIIKGEQQELIRKEQFVRLNDPVRLLEKGYSLTYFKGKIIKSSDKVKRGDEIEMKLKTGSIKAEVK
ncbi:exodeoxyribonuclease VII large subunit [Flavobacteriales bacterium]|nr:exodeoxyribonuclease VII large subunit [Flavobacteriales bacterium]